MRKLSVAILALAVAGTASAAGWRSLRIDASSEDAFNRSVSTFTEKLPRVRSVVFERSLQDIWVEGVKAAQADGQDYTITDYLRELDGLRYKEVVKFTDTSGDTANRYWDQAYVNLYARGAFKPSAPRSLPQAVIDRPGPAGAANHVPGVNPWQR